MTPDEVRMLDNRYALLFIRGERPVQDLKFDILHHPNVSLTTDGGADAYKHGEDLLSIASVTYEPKGTDNEAPVNIEHHDFLIFTEGELEEMINKKMEEMQNEQEKQE